MRQACRRNNPNKGTLIYIPYAPCYYNPSVYYPNCKTTHEFLIGTLLLLLFILPIYLGMCPSIPTHIHPYISKLILLLKTDDETNGYVYNGFHTYPGPWLRIFRCWFGTCRLANRR